MGYLYFPYSGLLNAIAAFTVGVFVLLKNYKSPINKAYAFFAASVTLWAFNYFLWLISKDASAALFFIRAAMIGAILIPEAFLYFVMEFTGKKKFLAHVLNGILIIIFISFSFSPVYIQKVEQRLFFSFWPVPGLLFHFMLLYFITVLVYAHTILWRAWNEEEGAKKEQVKYVLFGIATGFIGGCTNYFLWYNIPFPPYLNILVSGFVVFVASAIVKHQLMDINVIIKKTLVFTGLFVFVFALLILPTIMFQSYLLRGAGIGGRILGLVAGGIVIIFTMRKIEGFLINVTDKYLFQKKYDYKELLRTFTNEVLTVHNLDTLLKLTVDKLVDIVRVASCAVLLFDREKSRFWVAASYNVSDPAATFTPFNGTAMSTAMIHGHILMSDISEKRKHVPDNIKEMVVKLSSELVIPMILHDKAIGILSLGKKKSDEDYTQDDLDILLPLARTLAIAISNAELFEELGKTQAEAAQKEKMAVIGTLAAGMAHEIRNPITTIKIFTEFLKERKDDPRFIEKFEQLVPKEIEKINDMITHLLEFSKPADYKSVEPVDLREPLNGVLEILEAEMTLSDIILKERIEMVPRIYGNKKYIQEVLFNVIQNAIHAIGRRGTISVESEDVGKHIEVRVTDTGCGIAEEYVQHIFEPFFTTKIDSEGVGLGLYVIKQLMLRMGGNISVKSTMGKGTTFYLSFIKA